MAKKSKEFYKAPPGTPRVGVLDWKSGKYVALEDIDDSQPYYTYQGIGNTRAIPPVPVVYDYAFTIANFLNIIFGWNSITPYGDLTPNTLDGVELKHLYVDNANTVSLAAVGDVQIGTATEIEIIGESGIPVLLTWIGSHYAVTDPVLAQAIRDLDGQTIGINIKTL